MKLKLIISLLLASASCGALAAAASSPAASVPPVFAENPAFPAPAGLNQFQRNVWNSYTTKPGFRSIEIIQFDRSVTASNSVALNVKGKTYVVEGTWRRAEPEQVRVVSAKGVEVVAVGGGAIFMGSTKGGTGNAYLHLSDDGSVEGHLDLDGRDFAITSSGGVTFMAELEWVKAPAPAASGAGK